MREAGTEIKLRPKEKHGFHCTDFHENHINSVLLSKRLLYRILSNSDAKYNKKGKILFTHLGKQYAFPCTDFNGTYDYSEIPTNRLVSGARVTGGRT